MFCGAKDLIFGRVAKFRFRFKVSLPNGIFERWNLMTESSRCLVHKTMMGMGAEGGCGMEEKPCPVNKIFPLPDNTPVAKPVTSPENSELVELGLDLYSQAFKSLSQRSPFDLDAKTEATLPCGLASLLSKPTDSRRKHKRPHCETKATRKGSSEKSKSRSVWNNLEDYFRELTVQDIEWLYQFSSLGSLLNGDNSCFQIPVLGNGIKISCSNNNSNNPDNFCKVENDDVPAGVSKEENVEVRMSDAIAFCDKVEEFEKANDKLEDVKIENVSLDSPSVLNEGPLSEYSLPSSSSIEWVLGSRNRVLLTTTRPTKKRKLLGETAGLERLVVAQPCDGSSSSCHVCSMSDTADQLNQLVVCKSCNVVVHQKCYGVQGEKDGSWLCSWCKYKIDESGAALGSDRPCVLCPCRGGALKRFQNSESGNDLSVKFAHLFCSMWIPEVYIEDTRMMEPVLCHGIKDIREKLVCNLCKVKVGSCVRCSDGMFCSLFSYYAMLLFHCNKAFYVWFMNFLVSVSLILKYLSKAYCATLFL